MLTLVSTKVLSLSALGAGSFILGVLPLWLRGGAAGSAAGPDCPRHAAGAGPVLTALLSFGAGALLSTALVHMLAEASELLPRAAPVALLVGFLVLYLVDELVQRLVGHSPAAARAHRHLPHAACPVDEPCPPASKSPSLRRREDYGSMDECVGVERLPAATGTEAACLLSVPSVHAHHDQGRDQHGQVQSRAGSRAGSKRASAASLEALGARSPSETSSGGASCWGLLLALIIHSIIEGLAVGLEDTPEQVIFLLGAVSSHKLVVSFCLGAELVGGGVGLVPHLVAVLVFAGGSAAGVGVGMALYNLPGSADAANPMLLPVLQAAAAGTLLYVTLAEVLPRERARSQHNFPRRFLQFVSFTAGAVLITVLVLTMPDEHHAPGEQPLGPV